MTTTVAARPHPITLTPSPSTLHPHPITLHPPPSTRPPPEGADGGAQEARRPVHGVLAPAPGRRPLQGVGHRQGDHRRQEELLRAGVDQEPRLLQAALHHAHQPARRPPPPHPLDHAPLRPPFAP